MTAGPQDVPEPKVRSNLVKVACTELKWFYVLTQFRQGTTQHIVVHLCVDWRAGKVAGRVLKTGGKEDSLIRLNELKPTASIQLVDVSRTQRRMLA